MPRNAPIVVLLATQSAALMIAGFVTLKLRPDVAAMFRDLAMPTGLAARLALSSSFLPIAGALSIVASLLALTLTLKRSKRMAAIAVGVTVIASATIFSVLALVLPIFASR